MDEKNISGFIKVTKVENNVAYLNTTTSCSIPNELIPEIIQFLNHTKYDYVMVDGIFGRGLCKFVQGSTKEEAIKMWKLQEELLDIENDCADRVYCYKTPEEALKALQAIKGVDFTNSNTSLESALKFCKEVMLIISKSEKLHFSERESAIFSYFLQEKGASGLKYVSEKFVGRKYDYLSEDNITELVNDKNPLSFPVHVFDNLINKSNIYFNSTMELISKGANRNSQAYFWIHNADSKTNHKGM